MKSELFSPHPGKVGVSFPLFYYNSKRKLERSLKRAMEKNYKVKMHLFFNTQRSASLILMSLLLCGFWIVHVIRSHISINMVSLVKMRPDIATSGYTNLQSNI